MKHFVRTVLVATVGAAMIAGCGGGDSATDATDEDAAITTESTSTDDADATEASNEPAASTTPEPETTEPETAELQSTEPETTESSEVSDVPETSEAPVMTVAPEPPESALAEPLGLDSITILTPESGGGDRPELAWTPVDDAARYHVTVLAPDGSVYWGWTGSDASIPFGGLPQLLPEAAGPRIIAGMSWTVLASDADALPLAIGGPAPLSP